MGNPKLLGAATIPVVTAIGLAPSAIPGVSDAEGANRESEVRVHLHPDPTKVETSASHGLHLHGNGDPSNGAGWVADPANDPATRFVSADGRWRTEGHDHTSHLGDLPDVFVTAGGTAEARFSVPGLNGDLLDGRTVVLRAPRDSFGNVPVGTTANQYKPNGPDATTTISSTGSAGALMACGAVGDR